MSASGDSYRQILRSSSIIGGAQAASYLIGLVRVKLVAILLGPSGVGLVGLYTSAAGLVGIVSGLGVSSSAVREIVRAYGSEDEVEAARTTRILRRVCWFVGLFGWAIMIVFREPLSEAISGSRTHAPALALLGSTLLLNTISAGQLALLQGLRRISDLARAEIFAATAGSIVTLVIYAFMGEAGVAPAMIASSAIGLGFSFLFARQVEVAAIGVDWRETWAGFRRLAGLGLAFMWSGVVSAGLDMLMRALVLRKFGIASAGMYQASWAASGVFANFVLTAMSADFYPRLTIAIHDRELATNTVNEQTEIGILLALPGLVGVLTFAPLVMSLLYTSEFHVAADMLPWMALAVLFRVICWPLGYVQLAAGASRAFALSETSFFLAQAGLAFGLVEMFGLMGVAYALPAAFALYSALTLAVAYHLIGFTWSPGALHLIAIAAALVVVTFLAHAFLPPGANLIVGGALTLGAAVFSLRELATRVGSDHRLIRWAARLPVLRGRLLGPGR